MTRSYLWGWVQYAKYDCYDESPYLRKLWIGNVLICWRPLGHGYRT